MALQKRRPIDSGTRRTYASLTIGIILGALLSHLLLRNDISLLRLSFLSSVLSTHPSTSRYDASLSSSSVPRPNLETLIQAVERHASDDIREQCVALIRGKSLSASFSQAGQDWFLFHNFFSQMRFGEGFYLDIGANHPRDLSNSFFFDRCLGWQGLCIEPNEKYHPLYENRTCTLVKNCIYDGNITISMDFKAGTHGRLGTGSSIAQCRPLEEILSEHGVRQVQFASLDVEGSETNALHCFPFHSFDIKVWLVETDKVGAEFNRLMIRAGYALVGDILCPYRPLHSDVSRVGVKLDSVFEKRHMPMVIGPDFLWGEKLHGKGPRPACKPRAWCPQQIPTIEREEVHEGNFTLKLNTCRYKGLPLSEHPNVFRVK